MKVEVAVLLVRSESVVAAAALAVLRTTKPSGAVAATRSDRPKKATVGKPEENGLAERQSWLNRSLSAKRHSPCGLRRILRRGHNGERPLPSAHGGQRPGRRHKGPNPTLTLVANSIPFQAAGFKAANGE